MVEDAPHETSRPGSDAHHYHAFLSYSHRDRRVGAWLHRALEGYRLPKRLVGRETNRGVVPARVYPVFRDREELPTSANLGRQIDQALEDSATLVVVCSPHAARSKWVNREVTDFKLLGRRDRILSVIVSGEPNADAKPGSDHEECFPDALRYELDEQGRLTDRRMEPIAADLRPHGDGRRDTLLKLVAGIVGVGLDDLKHRDAARRHRRLLVVTAGAVAVAFVTIALAVVALFARADADRQRIRAERESREVRRRLAREYVARGWQAWEANDRAGGLLWHAEALRVEPPGEGERDHRLRLARLLRIAPALREARLDVPVVRDAVAHPDGRRLAVALDDGSAWQWDVDANRPFGPILRQDDPILFLAYDAEGRWLVTCDATNTARVRDATTGQVVGPALRHEHGDYGRLMPSFAPTGSAVLTRLGRNYRLWDAATGVPLTPELLDLVGTQFTEDGRRLVVWTSALLRSYDTRSGRLLQEVNAGHDVYEVLVDDHGQWAVTRDGPVARWWDLESGRALSPVIEDVEDVAFAADGVRVLRLPEEGPLRISDLWTGEERAVSVLGATGGRLSPDASRLLVWTQDRLDVCDAETGVAVAQSGLQGGFLATAWAPDGARVFTRYDRRSDLWDPVTGAPVGASFPDSAFGVFAASGTRLITASSRRLAVWDAASGARRADLALLPAGEFAPTLLLEGPWLLSLHDEPGGRYERFAWLWDLDQGARVFPPTVAWNGHARDDVLRVNASAALADVRFDGEAVQAVGESGLWRWEGEQPVGGAPTAWPKPVLYARFLEDGRCLTVDAQGRALLRDGRTGAPLGPGIPAWISEAFGAAEDRRLQVAGPGDPRWDAGTGEVRLLRTRTFTLDADLVHVDVDATGSRAATASIDDVRLYDLATGREVGRHRLGWNAYHLALAPDGSRVALAIDVDSKSSQVVVWDPEGEGPVGIGSNRSYVTLLAFDPTGRLLAIGHDDRTLEVWDVEAGVRRMETLPYESTLTGLAFDPRGERIAVSTFAGRVDVYEAGTGRRTVPSTSMGAAVRDVAFSPDGLAFAIAATNGEVQLRSTADGALLGPGFRMQAAAKRVRFRADGQAVLTLDAAGRIEVHALVPLSESPTDLVRWAEIRSGRRVTTRGTAEALTAEDWHARLLALPAR